MLDVMKNDKKFNMTNWTKLDTEDAARALVYKDQYGINQAKYDQALAVAKCHTSACFAGHLALSSYMKDRIKLTRIEANCFDSSQYSLTLFDSKSGRTLGNRHYVDLVSDYLDIDFHDAGLITAYETMEDLSWDELYCVNSRDEITPQDVIKALMLLIKRDGKLECDDNVNLISNEEYNDYITALDKPKETEKPIKSIMDITAKFLR